MESLSTWIILLIAQLLIGWLIIRYTRRPFRRPGHPRRARLDTLYRDIHSGDPADGLYAWYRVREHIRHFEPDANERQRLLEEVAAIIKETETRYKHRVTPVTRLHKNGQSTRAAV